MDGMLSTIRRDLQLTGSTIRLINRSRADALNTSFVDRRYCEPYRGYPLYYDGTKGATLDI
eukprot:5222266-Karenia_brevis.AAC.1